MLLKVLLDILSKLNIPRGVREDVLGYLPQIANKIVENEKRGVLTFFPIIGEVGTFIWVMSNQDRPLPAPIFHLCGVVGKKTKRMHDPTA